MPRPTPILILLTLSAVVLLPTGCGSNDPAPDKFASFDRTAMLTGLADNVLLPAFAGFAAAADSLNTQAAILAQQPSAAALAATQARWVRAATTYHRCEPYQFGPFTITAAASLNYWPTRAGTTEAFLANNAAPAITATLLAQQGTPVRGLAALEYALYHGGPADALARYTTAPDADKRRAYLLALAQNLNANAAALHTAWQSYRPTYLAQSGQDINGSINLTVNALVVEVDKLKNANVGNPAGKKDGHAQPETVEAHESGASLLLLQANLTGLERLFIGSGPGGNDPGLNALLDHLEAKTNGQPLSAAVLAQLADARANAQALAPATLAQAIAQNPTGVTALYDSLKKLLVLTRLDVVSDAGLTLTFSDNDGD